MIGPFHGLMELAWAAGFFDGEGSVSTRQDKRPGRQMELQLGIEQTDIRPLQRFQDAVAWPGNIVLRPPRAPARKPLYRIAMCNRQAIATVGLLWPYLSEPKREQWMRVAATIEAA